jgi:hypothetical protein
MRTTGVGRAEPGPAGGAGLQAVDLGDPDRRGSAPRCR